MNNTITFPQPTLFGTLELIKSVYRAAAALLKGRALEAEYTQPVYYLTDLGCCPITMIGGEWPCIILFDSLAESKEVGQKINNGTILVPMVAERANTVTQAKALGMGTVQYTDIQDLF